MKEKEMTGCTICPPAPPLDSLAPNVTGDSAQRRGNPLAAFTLPLLPPPSHGRSLGFPSSSQQQQVGLSC